MIDLERILDQQEPLIRDGFLTMIANMRDDLDLEELERLLEEGRLTEALDLVLASAPNIATASGVAFMAAAQDTAEQLGRELGVITVDFDVTNTRAVAAMQRNRLTLVTEFTRQQTAATQQALVEGIRSGANPREQALAFRDSIGLTARQQAAVASYERALRNLDRDALRRALRDKRSDSAVLRAIQSNTPLSDNRITAMVDRYRMRMIAFRAETIARTEALRSVHEGSEVMFEQAFADGTLEPDQAEGTWFTAKDERVRGSHRPMHGQKRPIGEPFVSGNGNLLMRPGDPSAPAEEVIRCRCRKVVTIKVRTLQL